MTTALSRASVLLSPQRALWDAVTPGLRGVAVRFGGSSIEGRMIYDHDPGPEDDEDCSLVETYVAADFLDDITVSFSAVAAIPPEPRSLLAEEAWVYLRKEPAPPEPWHPHRNPAATPLLDSPRTRGEFATFIDELATTIMASPDAWENAYLNRAEPVPETPSWNLLARMLHAGTGYE